MAAENLEALMADLESVLEGGNLNELTMFLSRLSPYEYVEVLERLDVGKRSRVVSCIPLSNLKPILNKLSEDLILELLRVQGIDNMAKVLVEMPSDEVADLLLKIPHKIRTKLANLLPHWKMIEVMSLLKYPSESAGGIMTPQVPIFIYKSTVGEAIKEYTAKNELGMYDKHSYVYVVDENRKFLGWVDVKSFISLSREKLLKDVISKPPATAYVRSHREEVAKTFVKYDLIEIPVLDEDGRLLGAVTIDDVLDVAINEYSEDLLRFGGFIRVIKGRYLTANPISIVRSRLAPLVYLYIMNVVTGWVIASFIGVIERIAVLAAFLPMLSDNSGNVGAQASTFIIRSLAVGEIGPQDIIRVLKKEMIISLTLIALLSPISFLIGALITFTAYMSVTQAVVVGLIVAVALIASTLVTDITGVLLPLLLPRLRIDPVTISAPLITTVGDIITTSTYFVIATSLISVIHF